MIDITKPLRTRDGCDVTILGITARGKQPLYGLIHRDKHDAIAQWNKDGAYYEEGSTRFPSENDLENKPAERWVNLYTSYPADEVMGYIHSSEADATKARGAGSDTTYLGTIKLPLKP